MNTAATLQQATPTVKAHPQWLMDMQSSIVQFLQNQVDRINEKLETETDPRVRGGLVEDKLIAKKRIADLNPPPAPTPLERTVNALEAVLTAQHDPVAAEALALENFETLPVEVCPDSLHPAAQMDSQSLDDIADEIESAEALERAAAAKRVVTEEVSKAKSSGAESIVVEATKTKPGLFMDAETQRLYIKVFGSIPKRFRGQGARP